MKVSHLAAAGACVLALSLLDRPAVAQEAASRQDLAASSLATMIEAQTADNPELRREVEIGFRISPVRLDLANKSPVVVGLGSYLVNAIGGCNDCHTNPPFAPGHDPFLGQRKRVNATAYLAGGQSFGPGIVSRNLTPEHGLPAGRTFAQFVLQMRTGADLDHPGQLLQVMPWPTYQSMTTRDLRAIYTYLSAIPPRQPAQ